MNPSPIQFLRWLRWPNMVIIILTLAFIRYGLIASALKREGLHLSMDTISFVLLTLLTLIITFAGYVINDIYDQKTDALNKPDKQAIGIWMTVGKARAIYLVLVILGSLLTLYLGWVEKKMEWIWIYPLVVYLLWLYSRRLKGSILLGNLLVSLLCSGVALLVPFAEKESLLILNNGQQLMSTLYFYAAFAGISNLLREIIKDAEDMQGDEKSGLNTLAVVHGPGASKRAALAVAWILAASILFFLMLDGRDGAKLSGFVMLTLPFLAFILYGLFKNTKEINWKQLSRMVKFLMLGGLLGLIFLL